MEPAEPQITPPYAGPKSVLEMTDAERRALLRRRRSEGGVGMEIGGNTAARLAVRTVGRLFVAGILMGLFVVAFYRFTASWRVAALVVCVMGGYMLLVGRLVEGRADRTE